MNANYDRETDAWYLSIAEGVVIAGEEIRPGVVLDFDTDGRIVGIEVLDASQHLGAGFDRLVPQAAE